MSNTKKVSEMLDELISEVKSNGKFEITQLNLGLDVYTSLFNEIKDNNDKDKKFASYDEYDGIEIEIRSDRSHIGCSLAFKNSFFSKK